MPNRKTVDELCLIYLGNSRQFTKNTDYPENTPSNPNSRLINSLWYFTDFISRKKKGGKIIPALQ
jgi:hypothetical protein